MDEEALRSHGLHTKCYTSKPFDLEKFFDIVRAIEKSWLAITTPSSCATFPTTGPEAHQIG